MLSEERVREIEAQGSILRKLCDGEHVVQIHKSWIDTPLRHIDELLADRALRVAEAGRLRAELDQLRGLGRRLSDALHSHDGSLLIEDGPVESQLYNFDAWLGHGESGG